MIDALDESFGEETDQLEMFFKVLQDDVPHLPPSIRIFVTSRDTRHLRSLKQAPHFQALHLDIRSESNLTDIETYTHHALKKIVKEKRFDPEWPGRERAEEFTKKAEGLFIWVATMASFLSTTSYTDEKLQELLSGARTGLRAEQKMDALYSSILKDCGWDDPAIVEDYQLFMGALLASKVPLSASAIQSLLRCTKDGFQIKVIASRVSSLLTGWPDEKAPIEIIHQSLRDFLTERAHDSPNCSIDERAHSRHLAICCLSILVRDLRPDIPCAGFIDGDEEGVPKMGDDAISEELWYACKFGISHIVNIDTPDEESARLLREFLSTKLVLWMEVVSSKGSFISLIELRKWAQVRSA